MMQSEYGLFWRRPPPMPPGSFLYADDLVAALQRKHRKGGYKEAVLYIEVRQGRTAGRTVGRRSRQCGMRQAVRLVVGPGGVATVHHSPVQHGDAVWWCKAPVAVPCD